MKIKYEAYYWTFYNGSSIILWASGIDTDNEISDDDERDIIPSTVVLKQWWSEMDSKYGLQRSWQVWPWELKVDSVKPQHENVTAVVLHKNCNIIFSMDKQISERKDRWRKEN